MKFTYKLLSLGLAIACLSGCNAANTEIASSSAATATVDPATDSTEVPASNNVFTSAGDGCSTQRSEIKISNRYAFGVPIAIF